MQEQIAPALHKETNIIKSGDTKDIISTIMTADGMAAPFTRKFAESMPPGTVANDCRYLWKWVRDKINYKEDPDGLQFVQLPGALYESKKGDCKSMTLLTASVIYNLYGNIYRYRFISQDKNTDYHHVYLVVTDENGEDIILDCVNDEYGQEIPYAKKKDMAPYHKNNVNGIYGGLTITPGLGIDPNFNSNPGTYQGIPTAQGGSTAISPTPQILPTQSTAPYTGPTIVPAGTSLTTGEMVVGGLILAALLYAITKD